MTKPTQTPVRRMTEWETEAENTQLPAVRQPARNFVAPLPPVSSTFAGWQPAQPHELQPAHSVAQIVTLTTSHVDRARGFAIQTGILSIVVGILAIVAAVALFGQPLLTFWILVWFFTGFSAVWIAAYFWDKATSPDGIALLQVASGFRLIRKEQDFRHEYLRHVAGMPTPQERRDRRKAQQKGRR